MAMICPNCGSSDVHELLDQMHCIVCGTKFGYSQEEANGEAVSEPAEEPAKK